MLSLSGLSAVAHGGGGTLSAVHSPTPPEGGEDRLLEAGQAGFGAGLQVRLVALHRYEELRAAVLVGLPSRLR